MKVLFLFLATATISFVGSLQLGPVNLTVIQQVIRWHLRAGILVALGGCLPEMIYATAAVNAGQWLENHRDVWRIIEWAVVPVLMILGVITYQTPSNPTSQSPKLSVVKAPFWRGFLMGLLNPQLFPYWLVILVQFNGYSTLRVDTLEEQVAFVVATALGALGLLVGVAILTHKYKQALLDRFASLPFHRFLGVIFVGLALIQLLKLMLTSS